jgi:hypothetical protein
MSAVLVLTTRAVVTSRGVVYSNREWRIDPSAACGVTSFAVDAAPLPVRRVQGFPRDPRAVDTHGKQRPSRRMDRSRP